MPTIVFTYPGVDGLLVGMFSRYQQDDTNNIRGMLRYSLRNKGTENEIEKFIKKHEYTLNKKVGEYLVQEARDWPFGDKDSTKENRSRVRNEIVGMWDEG